MDRRFRARSRAALLCAVVAAVAWPAVALANVTTDLTDWNLTESISTWGGGTQWHISSGGDGAASFRWLDSPNKTTIISANTCADLTPVGVTQINVGDTGYHGLFSASPGACFVLRGRTAAGSGSMVNHDGRLSR